MTIPQGYDSDWDRQKDTYPFVVLLPPDPENKSSGSSANRLLLDADELWSFL